MQRTIRIFWHSVRLLVTLPEIVRIYLLFAPILQYISSPGKRNIWVPKKGLSIPLLIEKISLSITVKILLKW